MMTQQVISERCRLFSPRIAYTEQTTNYQCVMGGHHQLMLDPNELSKLANHAADYTTQLHSIRKQRLHFRVSRLQPNHPIGLTVKAF